MVLFLEFQNENHFKNINTNLSIWTLNTKYRMLKDFHFGLFDESENDKKKKYG